MFDGVKVGIVSSDGDIAENLFAEIGVNAGEATLNFLADEDTPFGPISLEKELLCFKRVGLKCCEEVTGEDMEFCSAKVLFDEVMLVFNFGPFKPLDL